MTLRPEDLARRVPLESQRPWVTFAFWRLGVVVAVVIALAVLHEPFQNNDLLWAMLVVALPWALFTVWLSLRHPERADIPLIAAGDMLMLGILEAVEPNLYAATRFLALAFLAVNAHLQGERVGVAVALMAALLLVVPTATTGRAPVSSERLIFVELVFVMAALLTVVLVGRFRAAESGARLQARAVTQRVFASEDEIRRDLAESLHDGPIQELIGLEMELNALQSAVARGDTELTERITADARRTVERNIRALRDEIVALGPSAFDQVSYEAAVERAAVQWKRRYDLEVDVDVERLEMEPELKGDLFLITQEAVNNAGRHGRAHHVTIRLQADNGAVKLAVIDDGRGFKETPEPEPGHIGVASMRERARVHGGRLAIESSPDGGTTVTVRAPLNGAG